MEEHHALTCEENIADRVGEIFERLKAAARVDYWHDDKRSTIRENAVLSDYPTRQMASAVPPFPLPLGRRDATVPSQFRDACLAQ